MVIFSLLFFHYKKCFIFLYFLTFANIIFAIEDDFQTKALVISKTLNSQRVHKSFSLSFVEEGPIAQTTVFTKSGVEALLQIRSCKIVLNEQLIRQAQLGVDALAVLIGHEMGHCEMEQFSNAFSKISYSEKSWSLEFVADKYGVNLAKTSGYDGLNGFLELTTLLEGSFSNTHPSSEARRRAVQANENTIITRVKQ
jgi:Zn-dependent protease with chaperone function